MGVAEQRRIGGKRDPYVGLSAATEIKRFIVWRRLSVFPGAESIAYWLCCLLSVCCHVDRRT